MTHHTGIACIGFIALALAGCDRKDDVREQVKDVQQAQQKAPEKAQELQQDLEQAKARVAQLEQKLTMAKQGVTDDVIREREELKHAVKDDEKRVTNEVREAQSAAQMHNADVQKAQKQLDQTQPAQQVDTQVKTETRVVPNENKHEIVREQTQVPVDTTHIVEHKQKQ
jgi:chromosome segregation ATPase